MEPQCIIVSKQAQWEAWFDEPTNDGCSGLLGGCKHCLGEMYRRRQSYLNDWLALFLQYKAALARGACVMPRLIWYAAPGATSSAMTSVHAWHCQGSISRYWHCTQALQTLLPYDLMRALLLRFSPQACLYSACDCEYALLMRQLLGCDAQWFQSQDQILGRYRKMRNAWNKANRTKATTRRARHMK